jgi:hypothetical protein
VDDLVGLLMQQLVYFLLLITVLLRKGVARTDGTRFFGMIYVRTLGKIYGTHLILLTGSGFYFHLY